VKTICSFQSLCKKSIYYDDYSRLKKLIKLRELVIKAVPLFNPQYDVMDVLFKEKK